MTGAQVRQARQLLGWSADRLGAACNLSGTIVLYFERTGRLSQPQRGPLDRLTLIKGIFEAAGVEFTNGDVPGVKLRRADL